MILHKPTPILFTAIALIVLSLATPGCEKILKKDPGFISDIPSASIDRVIPTVLKGPPEKMRQALQDAYRLKPDRRFLMAVSEISAFITQSTGAAVQAEFKDGQWHIALGQEAVGTLPDLPDFPDALALLEAWAKQLEARHPLNLSAKEADKDAFLEIEADLRAFMDPFPFSATRKADALWNKGVRHPRLLGLSAKALAALSLQTTDLMDLADPVFAKALALLALTRAAGGDEARREAALLAHAMGYGRSAADYGKSLDSNDPARAYVRRDEKKLLALASAPEAGPEAKFLWLDHLARRKVLGPWGKWIESNWPKGAPLPVLATGLKLSSFALGGDFSNALRQIILERLERGQPFDITNASFGQLTLRFESDLLSNRAAGGVFFDSAVFESYLQSLFYSSLHAQGLHYLDNQSSTGNAGALFVQMSTLSRFSLKGAKLLLQRLFHTATGDGRITGKAKALAGNVFGFVSGTGTLADDFASWYGHLLTSKAGMNNLKSLAGDITRRETLQGPSLFRTLDETRRYFLEGDPSLWVTMRRLVHRMDSRISHRAELSRLAGEALWDLNLERRMSESANQADPFAAPSLAIRQAYLDRDSAALRNILKAHEPEPEDRVQILLHLENLKDADSRFIKPTYRKLIQEHPDTFMYYNNYARFLMRAGQQPEARRVMKNWLDREVVTGNLDRAVASEIISESFMEEGHLEKAWEALKPALEIGRGPSIKQAGLLMEKQGNLEEAEKYFHAAHSRYGDSIFAMINLAQFYWRQGYYDAAGEVIANFSHPITAAEFALDLGRAFADIFADQSAEKGLEAFHAMVRAGILPIYLQPLPGHFEARKNHELAFLLSNTIRFPGPQGAQHLIKSYRLLKKGKGSEVALKWLRENLPREYEGWTGLFLFQVELYEDVWTVDRSPSDYGWLLRAASEYKTKTLTAKQIKLMHAYYNIPGLEPHYTLPGMYFLGKVSEEELLKAAVDEKRRCEYAFFIGFKAQADGRYEDASDWFRVALETGLTLNGEYRVAVGVLHKWALLNMNLDHLAKNKA